MLSNLKDYILNISSSWYVLLDFLVIGYQCQWNEYQSLTYLTTHHWEWQLWFCYLLSPNNINTCVLYHIFLSALTVMPLWSFHVYSCNSTYVKLTQEVNWVIFFLALYLLSGKVVRANMRQSDLFSRTETKSFNSKIYTTGLLKYHWIGHQ